MAEEEELRLLVGAVEAENYHNPLRDIRAYIHLHQL